MPLPLFQTEIRLRAGSMSTWIKFMLLSLWKLSAAFTKISSSQKKESCQKWVCALTKYFIQARDVLDPSKLKFFSLFVVDPEFLAVMCYATDVGVWSEKDVLKLSLFLINLFDKFHDFQCNFDIFCPQLHLISSSQIFVYFSSIFPSILQDVS